MIIKSALSRAVQLAVVVGLSLIPSLSSPAASMTLGWSTCEATNAFGYKVSYGTASGQYSTSLNTGSNTSASLTGLTPGTAYYLQVMAYDSNGAPIQYSAEVTNAIPGSTDGNSGSGTNGSPTTLQIVSQPVSQTVPAGGTATFSISATGPAPITYMWYFNAVPIIGLNSATLTIPSITSSNAGHYSVLVSSSAGLLMSTVVSLTVTAPVAVAPSITTQPASVTANAGATATFSVSATGTGPLHYQWYDYSTVVAGATASTLSVAASDATGGNYTVVVSNSAGSVTSSVATLSVIDPPTIVTQPASQSVVVGSPVTFRAGIGGTGPFTFQWYHNSAAVPGTQGRALSITAAATSDSGNYYLVAQNPAGTATSTVAELTVSNVSFAAAAGTYNGLFYQTNNQLPKVAVSSAGMLANCIVGSNGVYSAKLCIGGYTYPFSGTFNSTGIDTEVIVRTNGLPALNVSLQADLTGSSKLMTGIVSSTASSNAWTAPLVADLAGTSATAGSWYMTIPPSSGLANSPQGYAIISVASNGSTTVAGRLYDGSQLVESAPVSGTGILPLYFSLYGGTGLLEGWVTLNGGLPTGTMTWIRPVNANSPVPYSTGFTNVVNVY